MTFDPALRFLIGALVGAVIGSFLGALVARWPRGESVMRGRSKCDACGRALGVAELIPLVSYLALGRKCRSCGAVVDSAHFWLELGAALIGGGCFLLLPDPLQAPFFAVGGWMLLALAVLDARHFWLPDALTYPLAALGLTLGEWLLPASFNDRAIGAVLGGGLLLLLSLAYKRLRGREGLGLGDAKLLGAIGAWLGWQYLPLVLTVASFSALLWVLALRLRGTELTAQTRVPLGTFLCLAVVPAWAGGAMLGL